MNGDPLPPADDAQPPEHQESPRAPWEHPTTPSEPWRDQATPSEMMRPLSGEVPVSPAPPFDSPYSYPPPQRPSSLSDYLADYAPPPPSSASRPQPRRSSSFLILGLALAATVIVLAISLLVIILRSTPTTAIQVTLVEKTATAMAAATQHPAQTLTPQPHHTPTTGGKKTPTPQSTQAPNPGATATPTQAATATPTQVVETPTPTPGAETFIDTLSSFGYTSSRSAHLVIDSGNTIDGYPTRAARLVEDAEWIVWKKHDILNFAITTLYNTTDATPPFSFFVSSDGTTWTPITPTLTTATGSGSTPPWDVYTYSQPTVTGANYLKVQWGTGTFNASTPEIAQAKITFQP